MTFPVAASYVALVCFAIGMVWAAAADLVTMKIRNELVLFLLASYAILAPSSGIDWVDIGWSVAVAVGVLVCAFVLFGLGWIGGGDAKLAAVIALWLGADHAFAYVLYTALFGGILTIALLQFRLTVLPSQCLTVNWIMRLHAPETGVPYGVAIAGAALFIFPMTHWMKASI
ncbi:A24 family peptidase [Microvirga alba]|uniref:Prepilin peptidase n=1 Tax=Microvirga alba TaxID=2791025 RepID=A0A931BTN1_9HYPH|nr:prepilin peptidase [Microvirga alba]MBF9235509.1 prepilin peptidase [Microvirga alba]